MTTKVFNEIIDRLFPIRGTLVEDTNYGLPYVLFDYPDYGGLPKRISYSLSPEAVDAMQDILYKKYTRKRDFAAAYKERLFELGEKIRESRKQGKSPKK